MSPTEPAFTTPVQGSNRLERKAQGIERISGRLSAIRLGSFAAGLVVVLSGLPRVAYWTGIGASVLAFGLAFLVHQRVFEKKSSIDRRRLLTEERRRRKSRRRHSRGAPALTNARSSLEGGLRLYAPEPESFLLDEGVVDDLGLAVEDSPGARRSSTLFGFLDWSSTVFGSRRLLHMLLHPLRQPAAIAARQEAVREIAGRRLLSKRVLETLLPLRGHDLDVLVPVLEGRLVFAGRRGLILGADILGTAAPVLLLLGLVTGHPVYFGLFVPALVVNLAFLGKLAGALNEERSRVRVLAPVIDAWLSLESLLHQAPRWGEEWSAIHAVFKGVEHDLRRLRRRVSLLQMHEFGLLFELLNFLTLWELRLLPRAADLIERNRDGLRRALGALGEVEALLQLALPLMEQPDFELPEALGGERPLLRATGVGHPLLDPGHSVHNPVELGASTRILVVTGSNMAGKSTYLKSVGCNLVLASMGAPVCAREFQWTPMSLHTDVNVRDSLDDGKSYFQVEVERVREAIEATRASPFVLVLFDELFRGTNSTERQAASRAILRYLASTGALAIVATHDHALTTLDAGPGEECVENRHFQESISESGMSFDYRLREGPATTRNALRLLELSGYPEVVIRQAHDELE